MLCVALRAAGAENFGHDTHIDDSATVAARPQTLMSVAEHEVNELLRGTVATSVAVE